MKKKRLLWLCFGVSLALFLLTAMSSQIASGLPRSLSRSPSTAPNGAPLGAPSDYRTIELMHYRPIELLHYQTNPTPTPLFNPTATPPTQGGHGKDIFFVYCMPCHGDQGQGLTDEFRNRQYPPEDVNCWKSGCHGARPYENGFTLPKTVPVLIGAGALQHFDTAQNVYDFMRRAMPFNQPGSLSDEQYLQLLAFLLESNRLAPAGARLEAASLSGIPVRQSVPPTPAATATPAAPATLAASPAADVPVIAVTGAIIFLALAAGLWIAIRRRRSRAPRAP